VVGGRFRETRNSDRETLSLFVLLVIFAVEILAASLVAEAAAGRQISYQLEPITDETSLRFRIELHFNGHESGRTELILPSRSAGQTKLYEAVQKLEIWPAHINVADSSEPWLKVLTHEPGAAIRVRYELVQDRADALQAQRGAIFRPVLQPRYFHWLGNAWVRPGLDEAEPLAFTIEWKNLPPDWTISNTFGEQQRQQQFTASLRAFTSSVFVGGDFRLRSVTVKEQPVRIALRGAWSFTDDEFAALVEKIFALQRGFWNDFHYPNYLVTLLPLEAMAGGAANSGTGLNQSFATSATPNSALADLKYLLAHELFHNWNARRLGRMKEPQELMYWFSEGFTDYYSFRLLWRGGLLTLDEYVAKYNETLRRYYTSPQRSTPNERIACEYFSNAELSRLTYLRGHLLAANWDALIRTNADGNHSLDDVMQELFRTGANAELSATTISAAVTRYAKVDVLPEVKRIIDSGELLVPHNQVFGACATLTTVEVADFELGFDLDTLQARMRIQGVLPHSAAYRAGLRDGQIVVRRQPIAIGQADREIELTIKDNGKEKPLRFYPASNTKTKVPQFKLPHTREQKAQCERAF
jgi:predicted metalloprotease with PDZ domain